MLVAALEANCVEPSAEVVEGAVSRYWSALAEGTRIFADAAAVVGDLRRTWLGVHLATNSDGNLRFDDRRKTLVYEPAVAERAKRWRLRCLADLGFRARDLTVGDPIGKPDPRFCRKVLRDFSATVDREVDLLQTTVVGDSLGSDVLPLLELGAARGLWLRRDSEHGRRSDVEPPKGATVIRSLAELGGPFRPTL